jgi:hypothetical protein
MAFESEFADNSKLVDCAAQDIDHIGEIFAPKGPWVVLIKKALNTWAAKQTPPVAQIAPSDQYDKATGDLVALYKSRQSPPILNFKGQIDRIVGKKTVVALDKELPKKAVPVPPTPPPPPETKEDIIKKAFQRSRQSLLVVLAVLRKLEADIERADRADGIQKVIALSTLGTVHNRNIAVISLRLKVSRNPLSAEFRDALKKSRELIEKNIAESSKIIDEGNVGRCDPAIHGGSVPNAATSKAAADPRVSVCIPFFSASADLQRDILTHEFFHLVGLADISVANAAQGLNNANTMAQIVAFIHDRGRQANSDGAEAAVPPLPSP